jgi:hypothetical protein
MEAVKVMVNLKKKNSKNKTLKKQKPQRVSSAVHRVGNTTAAHYL